MKIRCVLVQPCCQQQSYRLILLESSGLQVQGANPHWSKRKLLRERGKYFFTGNGLHLSNLSIQVLGCAVHKADSAKLLNGLEILFQAVYMYPTTHNHCQRIGKTKMSCIHLYNCCTRRLGCKAVLRPLPVIKERFLKVPTGSGNTS